MLERARSSKSNLIPDLVYSLSVHETIMCRHHGVFRSGRGRWQG